MAEAVGEALKTRGVAVPGDHQRKRLLDVVRVDELAQGVGLQFLASPAQQLLPRPG